MSAGETIMTELELIRFINDNTFGVGFGFDLGTGEIYALDDNFIDMDVQI